MLQLETVGGGLSGFQGLPGERVGFPLGMWKVLFKLMPARLTFEGTSAGGRSELW